MKNKASLVIAVLLVLGVAAFSIGDASQTSACTYKAAKTAGTASACCGKSTAAVAGNKSGCSKGVAARTAGASSCSKSAAKTTASLADIRHHEGKRMILTGNTACGKCDLDLTEACQGIFQTADGKVYRLMKNNHVKAMRSTETDKGFRIVSYVRKLDGVKYLEVKNVRTL